MEDISIQDDVAISVSHVTMKFTLNKEKVDNLKEYMIRLLTGKLEYNKFVALDDINFEVKKGDRLAILGLNGAGKSTLLKTIVGVYKPTEGTIEKQGVIAPLLELGAGFDPNYSGRENIYLYGAILGYPREYLDDKIDEIIEFSELGHFIEVPVKNYSSGMRARLGFSIATAVEPDILILDEVLSVGDAKFRKKSLAKVQSMFDHGVTVLFVSHNIQQVKAICNKAILLEHGKMIANGNVDEVSAIYEEKTIKPKKKSSQQVVVPITKDEILADKKAAEEQKKEIEEMRTKQAELHAAQDAQEAARKAERDSFLK
jgi:ABC-2 type transport system ATP-binding protein